MKKLFAVVALVTSTTLFAGLGGSVSVLSDYDFRGLSASDNEATVQGTLGWEHASGLHLDAFMSPALSGDQIDTTEVDLGIGYGMSHGDFSWDASVLHYTYMHKGSLNYLEYMFTLSFMSFDLVVAHAPEVLGNENNANTAYWLAYSHECKTKKWAWDAAIGMNTFDLKAYNNSADDSYMWYHVGLTRMFESGLSANIKYVATDLDSKYHSGLQRSRFVMGLTQEF